MKPTPLILLKAGRQYRHNNNDNFVIGYDKEETDKVVNSMIKIIRE